MDVPLSNMDRVTQLEEGIDMLLKIMAASISYLSRKADFKQLHPLVPPTVRAPDAVDDATMQESTRELVEDLVQKAKEVEVLIAALPAPTETEEEQAAELAALEEQVQVANREYRDALSEAEVLQTQVKALLRAVCDEHQRGLAALAQQARVA